MTHSRRNFFKGLTLLSFAPLTAGRTEITLVDNMDSYEQYVHVYGRIRFTTEAVHEADLEALQKMVQSETRGMANDFMRNFSNQDHLKNNVLPYARRER